MGPAALFRRINDLTTEVRTLKRENETLRVEAAQQRRLKERNAFAFEALCQQVTIDGAREAAAMIDAQRVPRTGRMVWDGEWLMVGDR